MTLSLDAALSGMLEQQRNMESIANNIANANTTGYKRVRVHFQSLLDTNEILQALQGTLPAGEEPTQSGGVGTASVERVFQQGPLTESPSSLDFAILGPGFFKVRLEDGSSAFTRDGSFRLGVDGNLVMADGTPLEPPVTLPDLFTSVSIDDEGTLFARRPLTADELAALAPGDVSTDVEENLGRLTLVRFDRPDALASIGRNLYVETADSGLPEEGGPGDDGFGRVVTGFLEASNVDVAEELTTLIAASRAYQINLSAYRTIEEMLRQAGTLPA